MQKDIISEKRNIIIFGAGKIGKRFFEKYSNTLNIIGFVDNDCSKQGKNLFGLPIFSLEQLLTLEDTIVVINTRKHFQIAQQLVEMGLKIFWINLVEHGITYMDFSEYNNLAYNPKRVWLKEHKGVGGSCYAILKYAQTEDLDFVLTNQTDFALDSAEHYYAYFTSSIVVTQSMEYVMEKERFELWHGFPIKALCKASNDEKVKGGLQYLVRVFHECKAMCSYSKLYNYFFGICCDSVYSDKFVITGMPRNDLLLRSQGKSVIKQLMPDISNEKIVVYAPTFRECEGYGYHNLKNGPFFTWEGYSASDLEEFLESQNIVLLVKMHYAELSQYKIVETKHIKLLDSERMEQAGVHFYEMLSGADLLISDYSSIWVDYLLLDRPIIFAVKDLEDFREVHGIMVDPFEAWTPGEKVSDYLKLKTAMKAGLKSDDGYKEQRNVFMKIYHKYVDGNSASRVVDELQRIVNKDILLSINEKEVTR